MPLTKYYSGDKFEGVAKGGAYDIYGGKKASVKSVGWKIWKKEFTWDSSA